MFNYSNAVEFWQFLNYKRVFVNAYFLDESAKLNTSRVYTLNLDKAHTSHNATKNKQPSSDTKVSK